jgi:hypothetical protein
VGKSGQRECQNVDDALVAKRDSYQEAVARACRLLVGTWGTIFEELPEILISRRSERSFSKG